jgi:outer membrane receptor protein involved in Fe transport
VELTAGARVDKRIPRNDGEQASDGVFRVQASPRVGVLLVPTDRTTAKLLYGRAIRAPNVRELLVVADPGDDGTYSFSSGNINLVPENINTVEGELESKVVDGLSLRADGSYSLLNKEIDKIDPGIYCNLPGALQIVGAEAGFDAKVGPASLSSTYALTLASYANEKKFDPDVCNFPWADPYSGRTQYEFPPHMLKSRAGFAFTDQLQMWLLSEVYGTRPRAAWSPDAGIADGKSFALFHLGMSFDDLGPNDAFRVGASVRNLLDQRWDYGVYRDDANENQLPANGQSRSVLVDLEAVF